MPLRVLNTFTYTGERAEDLDSKKKGRAPVETNFSFRAAHTRLITPLGSFQGRELSLSLSGALFVPLYLYAYTIYTSRPI